jgi:ankyrin repeat protein
MARNKKYEALIKAVKSNDLTGAARALAKGSDPNDVGEDEGAALHFATSKAMVDLLCDKGANPDIEVQTTGDYYSPIHTAANGEVVRALAAHGANIEKLTRHSSQSAMHLADKPEIVDALMECGGAGLINQRDADGKTPADYAGYGQAPHDISVLRCLQKHGAKDSAQLDREYAERVAAKKAASAADESQGKGGWGR